METLPLWITLFCLFVPGVTSFNAPFQRMPAYNLHQMMAEKARMEAMSDLMEYQQDLAKEKRKQAMIKQMLGGVGKGVFDPVVGPALPPSGKANSLMDGHGILEGLSLSGFADPFGLVETVPSTNTNKPAPVVTSKKLDTPIIKAPANQRSTSRRRKSKKNAAKTKLTTSNKKKDSAKSKTTSATANTVKTKISVLTYPVITLPSNNQFELCMETPKFFSNRCSQTIPCKYSMTCVRNQCCASHDEQKDILDTMWEMKQYMAMGGGGMHL